MAIFNSYVTNYQRVFWETQESGRATGERPLLGCGWISTCADGDGTVPDGDEINTPRACPIARDDGSKGKNDERYVR